jgi:hypothetical protein
MSFLTGTNTELIYGSTAAGVTQASFTTEQQFNTTGTMGVQAHLPPDFWTPNNASVGKGIKIVARGILASTATPTYTFTVRGGAAANVASTPIIAGSGAISTISGATTSIWEFEADCILKTIGATGQNSTLTSVGRVLCNGLLATANWGVWGAATSPGTVATLDTSITNYLNFNIACSANSASNTITLQQLLIFGLN